MPDGKLLLVVDNVRSVLNVGALFRTADAVGVAKIYLCGYTPCPTIDDRLSAIDKIRKTALGAERSVPWEHSGQTWRLLEKLKQSGASVVALEQSPSSVDYRKFKPQFPLALVVGNEVGGLGKRVLERCDSVISLPMRGSKESLNVAIAFGIAAYKIAEEK